MNPSADDLRKPVRVPGERGGALWRYAPLVVIAVLVALAYGLGLHRELSFETLIRERAAIDRLIIEHSVLAVAAYLALYIAAVGLSLPCGAILTVTAGFLFGPALGTLVGCLGGLTGAVIIFLVARSAFGEFLTRRASAFAARLAEGFRADAFNYLLFLRVVPFPFWAVNLASALFNIPLKTFVVATAIGIIPATAAFAVFGAGLDSVMAAQEAQYKACRAAGHATCSVDFGLSNVFTPTLVTALAALGALALLPVVARRYWGRSIPSKH